jgi:hypothetical protein
MVMYHTSHFYRFTVMDTSFHASENDFICEHCGKCLKSRSGLRRHRLRQHLKQEIKFKCTTDSCTAAFCERGELLAHQTNHGEQKRITCNYSNHKLSGNITELTRQRFFHMFGEDYIFRTTHIFLWIKWLLLFRHFPQSSHIKSFSEAWKDVSITVNL